MTFFGRDFSRLLGTVTAMNSNTSAKKITIKFVESYGVFLLYVGSKNVGSTNTNVTADAVEYARKKFPRATLIVKDFYKKGL